MTAALLYDLHLVGAMEYRQFCKLSATSNLDTNEQYILQLFLLVIVIFKYLILVLNLD